METQRGRLEVVISDEERFFNLNTVGDGKLQREVFERLLGISPRYAQRLLAWIGKESPNFESEFPVKGSPMDSPYELRFLGMNEKDLYSRSEGTSPTPVF